MKAECGDRTVLTVCRNGQPRSLHRLRTWLAQHQPARAMDATTSTNAPIHHTAEVHGSFPTADEPQEREQITSARCTATAASRSFVETTSATGPSCSTAASTASCSIHATDAYGASLPSIAARTSTSAGNVWWQHVQSEPPRSTATISRESAFDIGVWPTSTDGTTATSSRRNARICPASAAELVCPSNHTRGTTKGKHNGRQWHSRVVTKSGQPS